MSTPFHTQLAIYISQNDIDNANTLLMKEMGKAVVHHRADFVDLLQNSDVPAHADFADEQLINLYFDNIQKKDILVGSALLVNMKNKVSGFDGESEISDKGVKDSYNVMSSYFGGQPPFGGIVGIPNSKGYKEEHQYDWKYSGFGGSKIVGSLLKNIGKGKSDMSQSIQAEKQAQQAKKDANKKTMLIVGGSLIGLALVGFLIYKLKK